MTEDEKFWEILTSTVMPFKHNRVKTETKKLNVCRVVSDVYPTVLDLHGKKIQSAYESCLSFIEKHLSLGTRYIMIITGKGKDNSGMIRKEMNNWLETDKFKKNITHYEWLSGNGAVRLYLQKLKGKK